MTGKVAAEGRLEGLSCVLWASKKAPRADSGSRTDQNSKARESTVVVRKLIVSGQFEKSAADKG